MLVPCCLDHIGLRYPERVLHYVVHWASIASTLEPPNCRLPRLAKVASTFADGASIWVEARGEILLTLPPGYHYHRCRHHPPSVHDHPTSSCGEDRSGSSKKVPAEASGLLACGAQRVYVCIVLDVEL
jgi:hypothetical protein